MSKLNPRRRRHLRAMRELNRERNRLHPGGTSPKGLSVSPTHVDSLMGASHTPGFTGLGRSVGRETKVIAREGNPEKSRIDMQATSNYGRVEEPRVLGYTAPKSDRFASRAPRELYTNDERLRKPDVVLVKHGKGRFKRGSSVVDQAAPYHPGKIMPPKVREERDVYAWVKPAAYGFAWYDPDD